MSTKKTKDEWMEIIIYGLLAAVLLGLSFCLILMTGEMDKIIAN